MLSRRCCSSQRLRVRGASLANTTAALAAASRALNSSSSSSSSSLADALTIAAITAQGLAIYVANSTSTAGSDPAVARATSVLLDSLGQVGEEDLPPSRPPLSLTRSLWSCSCSRPQVLRAQHDDDDDGGLATALAGLAALATLASSSPPSVLTDTVQQRVLSLIDRYGPSQGLSRHAPIEATTRGKAATCLLPRGPCLLAADV